MTATDANESIPLCCANWQEVSLPALLNDGIYCGRNEYPYLKEKRSWCPGRRSVHARSQKFRDAGKT
jgi:hypothetical protein